MFKVQDLMIDVLASGGGGSAAMPAPTEPTPPSPISPIAIVTTLEHKFRAIDKVVDFADKVDLRILDDIALEVGRALVNARIVAYCSSDMATCENNARISPYAQLGRGALQTADFGLLHEQVLNTAKWLNDQGDLLEKRTVERTKEIVPHLKRAVEFLQTK